MFQWSEITDKISSLIETINVDEQGIVDNVLTQFKEGGLDLSALEGVSAAEALEKIDLANIDLSQFDSEQITMVLEALNIEIPDTGLENGAGITEWLRNK